MCMVWLYPQPRQFIFIHAVDLPIISAPALPGMLEASRVQHLHKLPNCNLALILLG